MSRVLALVRAWLVIDFFAESRRTGEAGSSLTTAIFGQSFLGLMFAALLLPDRDAGQGFVAYAAANLSLSMLLMGIGVLADPARLQRARADELLVRTAPVGRQVLALARTLHAGFSLSLVTIGIALAPAILSYWVSGKHVWVVPAYLLVACVLSGLVAATLSLAVSVAARYWGPGRANLVGATGRGLLLAGTFIGFALCLRHLGGTADDLPFGRWPALGWPAYWGARLLHDPLGAWPFAVAIAGGGALLYALSAIMQRAPRSTVRRSRRVGWFARLDRRLVGDGPLLAVTSFTSAMLYRSAGFRGKALPILGLPAAMVGLTLWDAPAAHRLILLGVALQLPAAYMPLLVAFLPEADEEGARWVFATSPGDTGPELARRAALVSLSTHVLLPAQLVATAVLLFSEIELTAIVALISFSFGSAVVVTALALRKLPCVPFTDESEGIGVDMSNLVGIGVAMAGSGAAFALVAPHPWALLPGLALSAAALRLLRQRPAHA